MGTPVGQTLRVWLSPGLHSWLWRSGCSTSLCWVPEGSPRLWVSLGRVGGQLSPTPACLGKGWAEPRETESRPSPRMSETRRGGQTERAGQDWSRGQETQEAALGGHELAEGWQGAEEDKGSRMG